ncbi:hypothetical protein [Bacillus sp. Bos-x628]|uniref:hypothetical protein n=1 Tax=Bacillus maqinnsis TaxID=3229854 RepID=UPI00338EA345
MTKKNPLTGKGTPSFDKFDKKISQSKQQQIKVPTLNQSIADFYNPPEKTEKKQVTVYLDTDVIEALDAWASIQEQKKGAKSGLINDMLKKAFNIRQE